MQRAITIVKQESVLREELILSVGHQTFESNERALDRTRDLLFSRTVHYRLSYTGLAERWDNCR